MARRTTRVSARMSRPASFTQDRPGAPPICYNRLFTAREVQSIINRPFGEPPLLPDR
jgi:hypothetical protein